MRYIIFTILAVLHYTLAFAAEPHFPTLSGMVVDQAQLLSQDVRRNLNQKLVDYEKSTSTQLVVVTLNSLEGLPIEEYGVRLGRKWGIGQKGKNNGVLLIVAPREHVMRIEVGYGLEGVLTDALASKIIQQIIIPKFKSNHIELGIIKGVDAILSTLEGRDISKDFVQANNSVNYSSFVSRWGLLILFVTIIILHKFGRLQKVNSKLNDYFGETNNTSSNSNSKTSKGGGSRSGGGSSGGGGGSFGGGGSSGGW